MDTIDLLQFSLILILTFVAVWARLSALHIRKKRLAILKQMREISNRRFNDFKYRRQ